MHRVLSGLLCCLLLPLLGVAPVRTVPPAPTFQSYALFFAVNQYPHPQLRNLSNPIKNARALADRLEGDFGFQTEVVENPSLEQIEQTLIDYRNRFARGTYDSKGQLFVFFSGHGEEEFGEGFFLPSNANPDLLRRTGLPYDYWRNFINDMACQHILVAVDACYSIYFDPNRKNRPGGFKRPGELSEGEKLIQAHARTRARLFFTSDGQGDQTPDKSDFAKKLQEGLMLPGGVDGILTSTDVFAALSRAFPTPHRGEFGDDQPGSSFLFVRKQNIDPLLSDLQAWQAADARKTLTAYRQYIEQHPQGDFVRVAYDKISELQRTQDIAAWQRAKTLDTPEAYQAYLDDYPQGVYVLPARAALEDLEAAAGKKDLPIPMAFIQGGTFTMGCTSEQQDCNSDEKPTFQATVSDFYLGKYEVTFEEYDQFCEATGRDKPSDSGWGRGRRPVINVSWNDAIAYCNWLSGEHSLQPVYTINGSNVSVNWQANGFRLPTEAEWEYAARQRGEAVLFGNGKNTLDPAEVNFYSKESSKKPYSIAGTYRGKTVPVGSLNSPNRLGLHDMSGNVWEWCWDWKDTYPSRAQTDYRGPASGAYRVMRGGSWISHPRYCRVAYRNFSSPGNRYYGVGFRLARH